MTHLQQGILEPVTETIRMWNQLPEDLVNVHSLGSFNGGFRPAIVKEVIHQVLMERLGDKSYDAEEIQDWSKSISDDIKNKLKDLGYDRYKFIVQVAIGEQRGEGVKMGCRCFWDSDTDNFAQDIFMNDSLFCVAAAFGVFYY